MQSPQQQANAAIERANAHHQAKRYEEAIAAYREGMALVPMYRLYQFVVGEMLFELQRYDEAVVAYQDTLEQTPDHEQAWNDLGNCLMVLDRLDEAEAAFNRAVELKPDYVESLYHGAMLAAKRGDEEKARHHLKKAIALRPAWRREAAKNALLKPYLS